MPGIKALLNNIRLLLNIPEERIAVMQELRRFQASETNRKD